jgi:hypothetical protein
MPREKSHVVTPEMAAEANELVGRADAAALNALALEQQARELRGIAEDLWQVVAELNEKARALLVGEGPRFQAYQRGYR